MLWAAIFFFDSIGMNQIAIPPSATIFDGSAATAASAMKKYAAYQCIRLGLLRILKAIPTHTSSRKRLNIYARSATAYISNGSDIASAAAVNSTARLEK